MQVPASCACSSRLMLDQVGRVVGRRGGWGSSHFHVLQLSAPPTLISWRCDWHVMPAAASAPAEASKLATTTTRSLYWESVDRLVRGERSNIWQMGELAVLDQRNPGHAAALWCLAMYMVVLGAVMSQIATACLGLMQWRDSRETLRQKNECGAQ
nr:hypothetical protein CFP56_00384 [Quercus suber]